MKKEYLNIFLKHKNFPLFSALVLGASVIFWNAIHYSFPMGYAGMFTFMAELISTSQFQLPNEVPYYGPGGLPFAYPPLGLYFFAFLIKIFGKTFIFLRLLPPLFYLLALIPLYFISIEISESKIAGFVTVGLATLSVQLYIPHALAAGIVRAPAYGLSLLSVLFFLYAVKKNYWRAIVLSGFFFGLTIMTHLSYAVFVVVWIVIWSVGRFEMQSAFIAIKVISLGMLIASPWIGTMLFRYGFEVFSGAMSSHGNTNFLDYLVGLEYIFSRFSLGIQYVASDLLVFILLVVGILNKTVYKKIELPLLFLTSIFLFLDDGERFIFTLAYLLIGSGVDKLIQLLLYWLRNWNLNLRYVTVGSVLIGVISYTWITSFDRINNFSPRIDSSTLEMGRFFQENTSIGITYLALLPQDEAEWFPYLLKREPIVAQWGSEWLGTYNEQVSLMLKARSCQLNQDVECLEGFFLEINKEPDYLIVLKKDNNLNTRLKQTYIWENVFENSRYVVWHRIAQ